MKTIKYYLAVLGLVILSLSNSFSQTYTLNSNLGNVIACSGTFVDQGGVSGNYSNNSNYTVTFCSGSSQHVRLDFSELNTQTNSDFLAIYDGNSTSAPLLANNTGNVGVDGGVSYQSSGSCLTVKFTSNGSTVNSGWQAAISCVTPCLPPNAVASVTNQTLPVELCKNETVDFSASLSTAQAGASVTTYNWNFDDGTTGTGMNVSHTFQNSGVYNVVLTVKDNTGCSSTNYAFVEVKVATTPSFVGITGDQTICAGQTATLDGVVNPTTWYDTPVTIVSGETPLPDDANACYDTELTFTQFDPSQTITSAADITSFFANLEHTWAGDLSITVICPSGQSVGLFNSDGAWNTPNISSEYFGDPPTGYDYVWTSTGQTINAWGGTSSADIIPAGTYGSEQPFTNLIGCPVNGTWKMKICDLHIVDDGTVFYWGINFGPNLTGTLTNLTTNFTSSGNACTDSYWSGSNTANAGIISSTSEDCDQIVVSPVTPGTYNYVYTVTDNFGCVFDTTIAVIATDCNCSVTTGNSGPVCVSGTFNLTSSTVAGATSITWTGPNGFTSNVQNPTGVVAPTIAGTYTYEVTVITSTGTCSSTTSVVVNGQPNVNAGSDQSVCQGSSVTLTGSGAQNYTWNNGATNGVAFTPASTTTYTVTGTDANGCVNTDEVTITVNALPNVNAGTDQTICQGGTVTLTGSGAQNYAWNNGATDGVAFTPASTTTYTVTGTDANGCVNTDQVTITVNALPNVNAGADQSVCQGGSITLTGSGAQNYSWNNGATNGVAFTPASTTTYTVTGTDANGCVNTDEVAITVNALPDVNAGADQSVCQGSTVTLAGSGAQNYTWNNGATDGVAFTPASTTTYTVTGTDANGCVNTDEVTITVNALPNVNAGTDQTICQGGSITLTGSGAQNYAWNNGATNGVAFTPASTTTYTVTGTDANGCVNTDQVTITVNALPNVNAGTDQTICQGALTSVSGTGAQTYAWNNGVTNGVAFTPVSTTTYTVTGTDANGCVNTDEVTITVNALPNVNAGADQSVCQGGTVTLTGSGAQNYAWNNGETDGVAFTPASTTTYTVTGTDINGCVNTDQVVVTVNQLPSVNAGTDQSVCVGGSVTLNGSGAQTYTWNNGVTNGTSFTPAATQTYTVTGTGANGCSNTDQVVVTVNPLPTVSAGADQSVCQGGSVTLTGSGAQTYTWNNGVSNGVAFVPSSTTTYTVTGTDANGCINTDEIVVTVNPLPAVSAGADQSICPGETVTLNGSGAQTYTWNNGVTNGVSFNPGATQTYTITGTDANGCVNTDQVIVTVNSNPVVTAGADQTVCTGSLVTLAGSGAQTYTWDNGVTNGVPFVASGTQTYTVTGTNAAGCQNTAVVTITVVNVPTASFSADVLSGIPGLTVDFTNSSQDASFYHFNFGNGQTYQTANILDTPDAFYAAPGVYTVILTADNGICEDTAHVKITVAHSPMTILIPNIFTPDGDGINDTFFLTLENAAALELVIVNRWGNRVAEISDVNGFWDGKINGNLAEEGVYFFKFLATALDGSTQNGQGNIQLIRK